MNKIKIVYSTILFLVLSLVFVQNSQTQLINRIVAVVNGEVITLHDLRQNMQLSMLRQNISNSKEEQGSKKELKRKVLESMINSILFEQEADSFEIEVSETEVNNRLNQIKKQQELSQEELKDMLSKQGLTLKEAKENIREDIKRSRLLRSMVRQKVVVTNEEIEQYYQKHKQNYSVPERLHLKILVMTSRQKLEQVRSEIIQGKTSFEQAAELYSQGPAAMQGGDLGMLTWKELAKKWRTVLRDVQPGGISSIFSLSNGYAILYLEGLESEQSLELSKVKEKIREEVYAQKFQKRFQEYVQELRENAIIEVRL